jgi:hypothetical protein
MGKPAKVASTDVNVTIANAVKTAYAESTSARQSAKEASAKREVMRELYKTYKKEFLAFVETITDNKLKVWVLKVVTWVKPAPKTAVSDITVDTAVQFLIAHGYHLLKNGNLAKG